LVQNNSSGHNVSKDGVSGISSVGSSPDAVRKHEVNQIFELASAFGGPLEGDDYDKKRNLVENFIAKCQSNPVGYITNSLGAKYSSQPTSEKLLWSLLLILMKFEGSLSSEALVDGKDLSTPEAHIVRLLLEGVLSDSSDSDSKVSPMYAKADTIADDAISQQAYLNHLNSRTMQPQGQAGGPFTNTSAVSSTTKSVLPTTIQEKNIVDADFFSKVEQLLIRGKREEACAMAVQAEQWPIALMIGSMCEKDTFQHMMKTLAEKSFPQQSTLHLMSLLYSNQAESVVRYGGRSLAGDKGQNDSSGIVPTWKRNLAAIVANKVGDWNALSRAVGDRIMESSSDIMAAHFAYLVSGIPCGKGKVTLLGSDNSQVALDGGKLPISDLRVLSAMRMTEIYEWCIARGSMQPPSDRSHSSPPVKKQLSSSFFSFFGLGGLL
jgi:hypothetical protein